MADLIAPGAWWLHGTRGSNVFLVEAEDGRLALIDTGFFGNGRAILRDIESVAPGRSLSLVLLTHRHLDHTGSAAELRETTGARIGAGHADCSIGEDGTAAILSSVGRSHVVRAVARKLGGSHRVRGRTVVDLPLEGEAELLPGLRAIPSPGHTHGSYCYLLERSSLLFVGDLVISHGGRLSRPLARSNDNPEEYEQTLSAIAQVPAERGAPGHGLPVASAFSEALSVLSNTPRRPWNPITAVQRAIKLHAFSRGMYRRREGR